MTISPQARAAFEAFQATRAGIKDQFEADRAARTKTLAEPKPSAPVLADQKAALSALKETGTRLVDDFQKARESYRASDHAKAWAEAAGPKEEERSNRFGPDRSDERDPFGPPKAGDRFGPSSAKGPGPGNGRDRFGEPELTSSFGPDRLTRSNAIRAYERAAGVVA